MEQTTKGSVFNAVTVSQWLAIPFILVLSGLITLGRADTFGDYIYTTNGATIAITGYTGPGGNVTIPDTILDKQVTSIASSAFAHNTNLTDIIIPDSVIYIGDGAFNGCAGLTHITIPNSVASLSSFAFSDCTGLRNLNVPDGVRSIMFYAFIGCTGLTNIFISKSVTVIEDNAFFACDRLETFTVDEANTKYAGLEGVLFNKNQSILVKCPSSRSGVYVIPNGVTTIAKSAFDFCGNLTNITIPNSLTAIGGNAFWWCTNLTSINFEGDAPTSVPTNIFYKATNVTVYYRAGTTGWSNTFAGQPTALWRTDYSDYTFTTNGASITITGYTGPGGNVTIPDTILDKQVTTIASAAFANNTNLTSVMMPNSVTSVGNDLFHGAFSRCSGLTNITLSTNLGRIDDYTFYRCTSLTGIIIPDGDTYIGGTAFDGCNSLTSVTIPNSVVSIGSYAFSGCNALQNATIPDSVRSIMDCAFQGCYSLTNVFISKNVKTIGQSAFNDCASLPAINVDSQNTNYTSLSGVLFNKSLTRLIQCPAGFRGDYVVPNGITNIGNSAFLGAGYLTNVTLPNSLTVIGVRGFSWCSNLAGVYFEGNAPSAIPSDLFYNSANVTVYYRAGTTGWSNTFAGQPTALWTPTYQEWARIVGLTDQFPNASGEGDDADHDGMSNLAEMQAGTDPMNANSKLAFESVTRPEDLIDADKTPIGEDQNALYFQSAPGRQYEIQSVNTFGGIWQAETNVTATTTQKRVLVKKPIGQGFYRVVLVP